MKRNDAVNEAFACAAMQGLLSNPAIIDTLTDSAMDYIVDKAAYLADAMLKERDK